MARALDSMIVSKRKLIFTSWNFILSFLIPIPILQLEMTIFVIFKCGLDETTYSQAYAMVKIVCGVDMIGLHVLNMTLKKQF